MDKRKAMIGAAALIFIAIATWALGFFGGTDPAISELQQLSQQMFDPNLPEAQRDQFRDNFRVRIDGLSDEQRRAFFDANREQWGGQMERRMNEFFAMAPAERQQRLDEIIDRMMQPRPSGTQTAGFTRRGDGQGRGNWANMTEAQRDERAKRRLDRTTATQRAQFSEFRRQLEARAKERGISKLPGFPGGRRGA
jgi:hypothetical protein